VIGVFWAAYACVKSTNFGGYDEWLAIWLNARGITSVPYANRPLVFFWSQPVRLFGSSLWGYWLLHGLYLSAVGLVVLGLGRRLVPAVPLLGYLAAVFSVAWLPLDNSRLDPVALAQYSGIVLAALASMLVFLESWSRSSIPLLLVACLLAFVAARGAEFVIVLLASAPLGLMRLGPSPRPRLFGWSAAWLVVVASVGLLAAVPVLWPSEGSYQASALGFDPAPLRVAARVLRLFGFHLLSLGAPFALEGALVPVVAALGFLVLGGLASARGAGDRDPDLRLLLGAAAFGALAAALVYLPFALSPATVTPLRTQMGASPGIAFLLAAVVLALARLVPSKARPAATFILAGWVVAAGTGQTLELQRKWDEASRWTVQSETLRGLVRFAPDLRPNTFVLLFDDSAAWPATFTFRHAVDYVYEGRALGGVWGAHPFLYPFAFTREGLVSEPWPVIRRPWDVAPTHHGYHEIVLARLSPAGIEILKDWPTDVLPAIPPGAAYDPEARIVRGGPPISARAILAER
jgi:hypothetical protein